ncbi:kelch-like protein 10 [Zootermopsis nevadensis]|uniref:Kelch-like protein diablo n=1 Tax=Zootermopsis nevadensis TaxID=136037 RepID=A0A067RFF4_ZOONE|nr:kelch-like protein 10 [Zootermopsis nevadensis]KDR21753.1 Kelch-like protein 10 [Zootermopsis nevadensis]
MVLNQHRRCPQPGGRCMCTERLLSLREMRGNNQLFDAVLRLKDGGVFPVHRVILSMYSEYFRNLFTTTLHAHEQTDILLHGVSSDMMTQILDYVYLREVNIHCDNACQLLVAADYLCIPSVIKLCCNFLMDMMDLDNCIDIMHFARFYFCADLETEARRFVLRHFVVVSQQSEELLEVAAQELQAIIESDELNVKYEKDVWECVLRWINHDPDNRKGHIADLLDGIRLGLLDEQFFLETVSKHPYVTENNGCRPLISETLAFLHYSVMMTREDKEIVTPRIARPRIPNDILFAVGGYRDNRPTDVIEAYDARADRWSVVETVDSIGPRAEHGTAVVGFDIYVIGGTDGFECLSSCRCFNAVTKTCREVASMHERRSNFTVAVLGEVVYAMGGYDDHQRHETAERYNYKMNQWSLIAPMNTKRSNASATVLNDKIYVAGGFDGHEYLKSVEVYDPETNQWTFVAPMLSRHCCLSCVTFHGSVYALGGYNNATDMLSGEKYDPAKDTWTKIPDTCYYPRKDFNAEVADDMIFVIGGHDGEFIFGVECFNDMEYERYWEGEMNVCRSWMSTCVIKDLPNVKDYIYKNRYRLLEEKRQELLALETPWQQEEQDIQALDDKLDEHSFNYAPKESYGEDWDTM